MEQITVKYGKLKRIVKTLRDRGTKDNDDISFEFLVGSCFPDVLNNIKEELRRQYTIGYLEGKKEFENQSNLTD